MGSGGNRGSQNRKACKFHGQSATLQLISKNRERAITFWQSLYCQSTPQKRAFLSSKISANIAKKTETGWKIASILSVCFGTFGARGYNL